MGERQVEMLGKELGIFLLRILDPCRTAGREHRKILAGVQPFNQFVGFLNDCQVGSCGSVVDLVCTHAVQSCNDSSHGVFVSLQSQPFAESDTDSRCDFAGHINFRIVELLPDLFGIVMDGQCTGGTSRRAAAAADALCLCDGTAEGCIDFGGSAPEGKVDGAHVLHFIALPHTVTAEDALAGIANDAGRGAVDVCLRFGLRIAHLVDAELQSQ